MRAWNVNSYAWQLFDAPLRRCNANFLWKHTLGENLMPRLNCMDMRLMRLGTTVLCKSLGYDPPKTSNQPHQGRPWLTRFQEISVAASAVCPRLSVDVLGSTPGNLLCRVAYPGPVCHAFYSSRTASCHPPNSLTAQQWRGLQRKRPESLHG